ncbi:MAG: sulfotransferase family 2 domain-containing protein [Acidobacteriota bacterium]|jgi:hypothetical protein|nr:sulfotransferase family 2 domain-containing protein [Acidobacteriota bacterium]HNQ81389.1 sulfotransferase family 2 domain-containing protein [Candidatus Aminicenantes bacterium]MDD8032507.1 sulfotransferase family 2 domain-containing protein [Acidobacteriota bacterium]NMD10890.1 sulfotransferase family protein [Acidobacteriota bacterium]HOU49027.1 sulfotransferase family 2 domain-containing protein [Candidatus Aminicenantes bacterium]
MLSHEYKCIFVHIPKVAGISIEQVFLDALGLDFARRESLLLGIVNRGDRGPGILSHLTAREYVEYGYVNQETFDAYFKFAFVRNPYDRVYSFYKYLGYARLVSFETFILDELPRLFGDPSLHYFIKPMSSYVYDESGTRLVDYVGKLETINEDFAQVARRLNLGGARLQNLNDSSGLSPGTHAVRGWRIIKKHPGIVFRLSFRPAAKEKRYTGEMKNAVQKYYEPDFVHFEYAR